MVDVFISYSRDNQDAVRCLAEAVKREGYAIWWDDELPAHRPYGDVITEKIDAAKAAIVVWSRSSAASEWVRAEADLARNQKKLIQASIDDRMPPMPFNQIQFASIGDWTGEDDHPGWRKVKASLAALCGPRGAVAPVAPRVPVPEPAPPSPRGLNRLLVGLIAVSLLVIATVAVLALTRGRADAGAAEFSRRSVILDPDGFTYVREGPSTDAPVITRVEEGVEFKTHDQPGDWWQIKLADGRIGYMARSRIRRPLIE